MPTSGLASIRQGTVERLAELPAFKHVFDARQPQLRRDYLPAIRVYTSATSQGLSLSYPEFRRTTALVVQIVCEDITDATTAERADELAEEVKWRLFGDGTWLTLFERVLSYDQEVDRNVEGEWRSTSVTLTFNLQCSEAYGPDLGESWERLPWLKETDIRVDVIDPAADPNTGPPGTPPNVQPQPPGYPGGYPGPDGRIEVDARFLNPPPEDN